MYHVREQVQIVFNWNLSTI